MNPTILVLSLAAGILGAPHGLRTELMEDTRSVYSAGLPSSATLDDVSTAWRRGSADLLQTATIGTSTPTFAWQLPEGMPRQKSCRVLVSTDTATLREGDANVWDSGNIECSTQMIRCPEGLLKPASIYYWTVKVTDEDGNESSYAAATPFLTSREWSSDFSRYPLEKTIDVPAEVHTNSAGNVFADFGKASFGQLILDVNSPSADTLRIHLGEARKGDTTDRAPGASVRYTSYTLPVRKGRGTYTLVIRPDGRNAQIKPAGTDVRPVLMPAYTGEVYPFRYCEIESGNAQVEALRRPTVHYKWDDDASSFHSSDSLLNAVWDLCKYSIYATSFAGVYVDGDRERIPYEADALINQLSHYCTDSEYTMARYTVDYLMDNATWPTEWILQAPLLVWNDYLYTGDKALLEKNYSTLKARSLIALTESNGLISTRTGKQTPELLKSCGYYGGEIRDIVDWPQSGALGIGKEEPGEADGYEFSDYNTVVNAYHYRALYVMEKIASALGHDDDAEEFARHSAAVKTAVNTLLLDKEKGCYRDGIGAGHYSLHASMFPAAFGMVPEKYMDAVMDHIRSRGMACSVYGAQFLLDALYEGGMDDYALELLTSNSKRSWKNMIDSGSTISWEAWDPEFKPNLDWNHAWGAAPANIIMRKLIGVEPLAPGWQRMSIRPRPGGLSHASATVPSILGPVKVDFSNEDGLFDMTVEIPYGSEAELSIPWTKSRYTLTVNGKKAKGQRNNDSVSLNLGGGKYHISVKQK